VSIAEAFGLMRGSSRAKSLAGRRREGQGWKARPNRDAALLHHKAAAKILDELSEVPGTRG